MKVLVSCDDYCYRIEEDYYLRDFGITLVNRYLLTFDEVLFAVRTRNVSSQTDLGIYRNKVIDERIKILPLPFFQGPKEYLKIYFKLKKSLTDRVFDCDMAILRLPSTVAFAVWSAIKGEIPYAIENVADSYDLFLGSKSLLHKMLWFNMHRMQQKACGNAIGVSCVTRNYLQKHYTSHLPGAIQSYYSSIEMLPEFRYRARKFPQKDVMTVTLVASQVYLNSTKGHKVIINSLKILRVRSINIILTLVGEDYFGGIEDVRSYARSLGVADMVVFTGFVNTSRLKEILLESDILVLPTLAEGLPRVIIEGMALGLPCITTFVSGNPELVDRAFCVDYSDAKGFADKIELLVTDRELYENQSRINYERSNEYCKNILDPRRQQFFDRLKEYVLTSTQTNK